MDEGREEEEFFVFEFELVVGFENSALAQQDGLRSIQECVDEEVPFFQGNLQLVHYIIPKSADEK